MLTKKKDLNLLVEALTIQFGNYIKYGEEDINTSVKSIYESLVDAVSNGNIENANEIAIFNAKQAFYNALRSIESIDPVNDVLNLKGPFESFFTNIYNIFRIFEAKCNREGRIIYKKIRSESISDDKYVNKYLKIVSEPGSLPLDLIKQIKITIYDNYTFEDIISEFEVRLFDDFESSKITELLANNTKYNESFFTEEIVFKLENDEKNLLDAVYNIIYKTNLFLDLLQNEFKYNLEIEKINKKIDDEISKIRFFKFIFIIDSIFNKKNNEIKYTDSIELSIQGKNGDNVIPGDELIKFKKIVYFYDEDFNKTFHKFCSHELKMYCKFNYNIMNEIVTINADGTCRYYLIPPTSKSKIYRKIREIAGRVLLEKTIAILGQVIMVVNPLNEFTMSLTSEERVEIGDEFICVFGYIDGKWYDAAYLRSDLEKNIENNVFQNKVRFSTFNSFLPILMNIEIIQEENPRRKIFRKK